MQTDTPNLQAASPAPQIHLNNRPKELWSQKWVKFLVVWFVLLVSLIGLQIFVNRANIIPSSQTQQAFKKFSSEEEFKKFIANLQKSQLQPPVGGGVEGGRGLTFQTDLAVAAQPGRVSQTNVQVLGIDEPDIVKTDGRNLFLSSPSYSTVIQDPGGVKLGFPMPPQLAGSTNIVQAFPVAQLGKLSKIDTQGELLLSGKSLTVLGGESITGFDVSDPKNPKETWKLKYEGGDRLVTARLYKEKLYLVTVNNLNYDNPCPMPLFSKGAQAITVPCSDIYYPTRTTQIDSTYTVVMLNPQTGDTLGSTSFLASSNSVIVYMSENALYILYPVEPDYIAMNLDFFSTSGKDLVPTSLVEKLKNLQNLDISAQAKMTEYGVLYEKYLASLSPDARLKFTNNFQNKFADYTKANARKISKTAVAKIDTGNLGFSANGELPGTALNQFSVDEYRGNLRVATTVGDFGRIEGTGSTANDIYILDVNLNQIGSIVDLGLSERIFSARFVGDTGYLVTFRQTDPFYVLDLSNPRNPVKAGELKIPGFSSYLDPLDQGLVLGVGQEGGKVKLSLFDVSNPKNPLEFAKYNLDDYWTEVSSNHHAFLADAKHKVFFLPGGKGGYVFSYDGRELTLKQVVADMAAQRAVYINDYLYVIGADKIVVLDENNWQTVASLVL